MSQIISFITFLLMLLSCLSCEKSVKRLSVEEEKWNSIFEKESTYSLNRYLNEYPHTLNYDSALTLFKQWSDESIGDAGGCYKNISSIIQIDKDSVYVGYSNIHINQLESKIYNILQENWSTRSFIDNAGVYHTFSSSIFLLHPKDSVDLDQNILIKAKYAMDQYRDSLINAWYPKGLTTELENTDFEKYTQIRLFFDYRKSIKLKPRPFY